MTYAGKDQGYIRVTVISEKPLEPKLPFLGRKLEDLTKPEDRETIYTPICKQTAQPAREAHPLVPRFAVPTGVQK